MWYVFRPRSKVEGDFKHCPDGYTEVSRNGVLVGVYKTELLKAEEERKT
jgi:hypothetical protein